MFTCREAASDKVGAAVIRGIFINVRKVGSGTDRFLAEPCCGVRVGVRRRACVAALSRGLMSGTLAEDGDGMGVGTRWSARALRDKPRMGARTLLQLRAFEAGFSASGLRCTSIVGDLPHHEPFFVECR